MKEVTGQFAVPASNMIITGPAAELDGRSSHPSNQPVIISIDTEFATLPSLLNFSSYTLEYLGMETRGEKDPFHYYN